jgi:hypothetical protein
MAFETWLDQADPVAARIDADKMFTYGTSDCARLPVSAGHDH